MKGNKSIEMTVDFGQDDLAIFLTR